MEKVDVWGKRRLSFEINKHAEGIYAVLDVNAEPDAVKELDRQLCLNESVLRTKVMRRETPGTQGLIRAREHDMAGDTIITVVGNLTADPELRFTPSGAAVANFTVASTPRTFDRRRGEWKDGEALFLRCNIWRQAAENVAESLTRGARVIVSGRLKQRSYETKEGEKRTVDRARGRRGRPSLRYATAKVNRSAAAVAAAAVRRRRRRWWRRRRRRRRVRTGRRPVGLGPAGRRPAAAGSPTNRRSDPHPALLFTACPGVLDVAKPPVRKPKKKVCASARTRRRTQLSTTRTPRCCASSSPTAARSALAG